MTATPVTVPPDLDPDLVERFRLESKAARKLLSQEFDARPIGALMPITDFSRRLIVRCVEADPLAGLAFAMHPGTSVPADFRVARHLWAVLATPERKIQFLVSNVVFGSYDLVTADFPPEVLAIQRRRWVREPAPSDRLLRCVIAEHFTPAFQPRIIDIGPQGLGLEFRATHPMLTGTVYAGCRFAWFTQMSEPFTLRIVNVGERYNLNHFRAGCELIDASPDVRRDFESVYESLRRARLAQQETRWHEGVRWITPAG